MQRGKLFLTTATLPPSACSGWNNPNAFLDAIISRVRVTTAARFA